MCCLQNHRCRVSITPVWLAGRAGAQHVHCSGGQFWPIQLALNGAPGWRPRNLCGVCSHREFSLWKVCVLPGWPEYHHFSFLGLNHSPGLRALPAVETRLSVKASKLGFNSRLFFKLLINRLKMVSFPLGSTAPSTLTPPRSMTKPKPRPPDCQSSS